MSRWTSLVLVFAFIAIISQPLIRSHEGHVHDDDEEDEHHHADETVAEETSSMAPPTDGDKEEVPSLPPNLPKEKAKFLPPDTSILKGTTYFVEYFPSPAVLNAGWQVSAAKKDGAEEAVAKYDGVWGVEEPPSSALEGDFALILKSRARHHAIATSLVQPIEFGESARTLVVQYEVKFENGMECGGAYMKLLQREAKPLQLNQFYDKTPYTIMFGPDKCGNDYKLHFIFRYKHPITGVYREHHAKRPMKSTEAFFTDRRTHLYTLVLEPSTQRFTVLVDGSEINSGSLLEDFEPPVVPDKEIVDPTDKMPDDWDEREKIPDPTATKPDDWDESQPATISDTDAMKPEGWLDEESKLVPDPDAVKPTDWDDAIDGQWEPRQIDNPKCAAAPGCGEWQRPNKPNPAYKGKWSAPLIANPAYKGKWVARKIPNPEYFTDSTPLQDLTPIDSLGLELWSMTDLVVFDNFLLTDSKADADAFAAATFYIKQAEEARWTGTGSGWFSGAWNALMELAQDKPWVWGMLALLVLLPLVLLLRYCFKSSGKKPSYSHKKTDEPVADSPAATSSSTAASGESAAAATTPKPASGPTREELEATDEEEGEEEAAGGEDEKGDKSDKADKKEGDEENKKEGTRRRQQKATRKD